MAPLKEIVSRTGLSDSDAKNYLSMAEDRVRLYLNYSDDEDVARFSAALADIAVSLYDRKTATDKAKESYMATAGMTGKSYSEGPVSVHENYGNSDGWAGVSAAYDAEIQNALNSIARFRRVRVVIC